MATQLEALIAYCRAEERVCPSPTVWNELWELLPERTHVGTGWQPSLPLILSGWWYSSNLDKMVRLREHLIWAADHGALDEVDAFLRALPEDSWHHLKD